MASVQPGWYNFNLNRAARAHCTDVVNNQTYFKNGGGHDDSNGTNTFVRIHKFSSVGDSEIYINIAPGRGMYRGFSSVASWLCDGYHGYSSLLPATSKCPHDTGYYDDGSKGQNGHRYAVMQSCLQFGCGVDTVPTHPSYTATCDCAGSATTRYAGLHIAAASHVGDPANTSKFMYVATILKTGITINSVKVIEETPGTKETITMNLKYQGEKGAVYMSPSYLHFERCHTYYFELTYNGSTIERYPTTGYFYTYGMNCDIDWRADKQQAECTSGECCNPTTKQFRANTVVCREKTGLCDKEENCTGSSSTCPADEKYPKGYVCNKTRGLCENDGVCNGVDDVCSERTYKTNETMCSEALGPCEESSYCNGRSYYCPSKRRKSRYTLCREPVGLCDMPEYCNGSSAYCPPDEYLPEGSQCNYSYNCTGDDSQHEEMVCNDTYQCSGKSPYCPFEVPADSNPEVATIRAPAIIATAVISIALIMLMF